MLFSEIMRRIEPSCLHMYYSRFTVGLVNPAPSPVSLLVVKGPLLGPEVPLFLSRFTVGGQFGHAQLSTLMSERCGYGPRGGSLLFPFHCWSVFRTSPVSHIVDSYEGIRRLYRRVHVMLFITRFTVGREVSGKPPTTFSRGHPGISKRAKRH